MDEDKGFTYCPVNLHATVQRLAMKQSHPINSYCSGVESLMGMSWTEIGLLALVAVVVFGGSNRLPEIARSFGKAIGELKKGMREGKNAAVPDNEIDPENGGDESPPDRDEPVS